MVAAPRARHGQNFSGWLYADDARLKAVAEHVTLKKLILVYKGWELVHHEAWMDDES